MIIIQLLNWNFLHKEKKIRANPANCKILIARKVFMNTFNNSVSLDIIYQYKLLDP
jgi:hypothetical protein